MNHDTRNLNVSVGLATIHLLTVTPAIRPALEALPDDLGELSLPVSGLPVLLVVTGVSGGSVVSVSPVTLVGFVLRLETARHCSHPPQRRVISEAI